MTFQERLASLKQRIEGSLPQEALDIMHAATAELAASGIQGKVLGAGDTMPAFTLPDENERPVNSSDRLAEGPLVITFYRGVWCPYCNADLANLKHVVPTVQEAGGTMIAVSPEQAEHSRTIIQRQKLPFPILTDFENNVAAAFGLRFAVPETLKLLYRDTFHIDLEQYSGDPGWTLPMPARFLVDRDGVIRYAESSPDYTQRPDPDDLVEVLKAL